MKFVNDLNTPQEEVKEIDEIKEKSEPAADSRPVEPAKPEVTRPVNNPSRNGKLNRLANFKKSPEANGTLIDVLTAGTVVKILSTVRDYYNVSYRDTVGYIKKNCVDEVR